MAALTPLATVADLAARAGETIDPADGRAGSVLAMASALVRAYVGSDLEPTEPETGYPDAAIQVTVDVAYRVWTNPDGLVGDSIDDASRRWSERAATDGFYLTAANKMILDSLRTSASNGGLWTLGVEKGTDYLNTVYVPTAPEPAGYPFPWYAADDPLVQ
jgi:hypothetical protein